MNEEPRTFAVLVVTNMFPEAGRPGGGSFVFSQVEALRRLGNTMDVLPIRRRLGKLRYLLAAFDVRRATAARRYDLMHAHYGLSALPALARNDLPLVVTLHGSDALVGRVEPAISRFVCRRARAVIAVSRQIAERIPGRVVPCGVDLERFRPHGKALARQRLGLRPARRYVLFPYAPDRRVKRFDLAQAAVQRLRAQGADVELLVEHGMPSEEMPWVYSAADVMILTSDSEGSPTSVKEALACNLPVVARNVGDVGEILSGVAGAAVADGDVASLSAALAEVLRGAPDGDFDGRTHMLRYDSARTARAVMDVYREALATGPRARAARAAAPQES